MTVTEERLVEYQLSILLLVYSARCEGLTLAPRVTGCTMDLRLDFTDSYFNLQF